MGRYTQARKAEYLAREAARNKPSLKNAKKHESVFVPQPLAGLQRTARHAWLISVLSFRPLAAFSSGDQSEFRNVTLLRFLI